MVNDIIIFSIISNSLHVKTFDNSIYKVDDIRCKFRDMENNNNNYYYDNAFRVLAEFR